MKLHDITIDGGYDTEKESSYMDHGVYAVRVGDTHLYGERHAGENEIYNITLKNTCGGEYVIALAGAIGNLTMYGIEAKDGAKMLKDDRTQLSL